MDLRRGYFQNQTLEEASGKEMRILNLADTDCLFLKEMEEAEGRRGDPARTDQELCQRCRLEMSC